jgi:hypothetical protein
LILHPVIDLGKRLKDLSHHPGDGRSQQFEWKIAQFYRFKFHVEKENILSLPHDPESGNTSLKFGSQYFQELVHSFTNIQDFQEVKSPKEVQKLFQIIDLLIEYYPKETNELIKKNIDFEEKFSLMSSSSQFLSQLEVIQSYLDRHFKPFQQTNQISSLERIHISIQKTEGLELLAKYILIIESENKQEFQHISQLDPHHKYCQYKITQDRLKNIKSKIIEMSEYYGQYFSPK